MSMHCASHIENASQPGWTQDYFLVVNPWFGQTSQSTQVAKCPVTGAMAHFLKRSTLASTFFTYPDSMTPALCEKKGEDECENHTRKQSEIVVK